MKLGDMFVAYRAVNVIEQRDLADAIGISPATLSNLEAGKSEPTAGTLLRILAWAFTS